MLTYILLFIQGIVLILFVPIVIVSVGQLLVVAVVDRERPNKQGKKDLNVHLDVLKV